MMNATGFSATIAIRRAGRSLFPTTPAPITATSAMLSGMLEADEVAESAVSDNLATRLTEWSFECHILTECAMVLCWNQQHEAR